jgi:hypothetical protein
MRYEIKLKSLVAVAALCCAFVLPTSAQTAPQTDAAKSESETEQQLYVVSAKAGGVNYLDGSARVTRSAGGAPEALTKGDKLENLDRVSVGADGKIEVLLNPGSYFRAGENAEFEFTDTALDSLKIKLASGNVVIEATAVGGEKGARLAVNTPQASVQFEESGLYRINVAVAATEIYVWKGEARVGAEIIKAGRKLTIGANGATLALAKFDREKFDALDTWSKLRAEELARLNNQLRRDVLAQTLAASTYDESWSNYWTGYWVYDRRARTWCFVPYVGVRRCCSAYRHRYNTKVNVVQTSAGTNSAAPVVVVAGSTKSDTTKYETTKSDDSSYSSSSTKSDDSPSTKSDSTPSSSPPPARDDTPPSKSESAAPSKSDDAPTKSGKPI